jgi:glycosyltransferase involved in cell wall biosynthesis
MDKKLRIAQIAPIWNSVPPKQYGGIERVVNELTEELVRRGHEVTLFATKDSKTSAKLVSTVSSPMSGKVPWSNPTYTLFNIANAYKMAGNFDIIHSHTDFWAFPLANLVSTPTVHTLHNRLPTDKESSDYQFYLQYPGQKLISISDNQRQNLPGNFIATVYNGVDIDKFSFSPKKGNFLYWTGRINYLKGAKDAVLVAKKLGLPLVFGGAHKEGNIKFYDEELRSLMDDPLITEDDDLTTEEESHYYQNALCTLAPIHWEEPFGLVMIESMASGTPVVAYNRGSVPEIIAEGKTGFIVREEDGIDGLAAAIKKTDQIKREDCRKRVEENFTISKMVDHYLDIYYKNL